jgi:hypothetical protein
MSVRVLDGDGDRPNLGHHRLELAAASEDHPYPVCRSIGPLERARWHVNAVDEADAAVLEVRAR